MVFVNDGYRADSAVLAHHAAAQNDTGAMGITL